MNREKIKERVIDQLVEAGYLPDEAERALPSDEMVDLILDSALMSIRDEG